MPRLSAHATYMASRIAAVPLMVNEVEVRARSMPSNTISISERLESDTPTLPTSGRAMGSTGS